MAKYPLTTQPTSDTIVVSQSGPNSTQIHSTSCKCECVHVCLRCTIHICENSRKKDILEDDDKRAK